MRVAEKRLAFPDQLHRRSLPKRRVAPDRCRGAWGKRGKGSPPRVISANANVRDRRRLTDMLRVSQKGRVPQRALTLGSLLPRFGDMPKLRAPSELRLCSSAPFPLVTMHTTVSTEKSVHHRETR